MFVASLFSNRYSVGCLLIQLLSLSVLNAQDAGLIAITKNQNYLQTGDNTIGFDDNPFAFDVYAEASMPNAIISLIVDRPSGSDIIVPEESGGEAYFWDEKFSDLAALNAAYPNGGYVIKVTGANDGLQTVNLSLTGEGYPATPIFTNYAATQVLDESIANTLTWNQVTGATAQDWMFLEIQDSSGNLVFESPFPGEAGALNGTSVSMVIPADTFDFDQAYTARLGVISLADESDDYVGVASVAGYQTATALPIKTRAPDVDAPFLDRSVPGSEQQDVPLNSVVTFAFSEPMDISVDPASAINWTGLADPGSFSYSWSTDNQNLFCYFTGGLPLSTTVTWELNPFGSATKLRDVAGNELLSGNHQGSFATSDTSNVGSPDVRLVELFKARSFSQSGDVPVAVEEYFANLFVDFGGISTVSRVDLSVPGRGVISGVGELEYNFDGLEAEDVFSDPDDLNADYPAGSYGVVLHTVNDGNVTVTLGVPTAVYPDAPKVLNFSATQDWDSTQPFTISWDPMVGGTANDAIFLFIQGEDDDLFESPGLAEPFALTGESTSITIPANTLPPGRMLNAELAFIKINTNDTTQYPGARLVSGIASLTQFSIQTAGSPYEPKVKVRHDGSMAMVEVTGERGKVYDVFSSDSLSNWTYLTTLYLYDNPEGFLSSASFDDFLSVGEPSRFYQLEEALGQ